MNKATRRFSHWKWEGKSREAKVLWQAECRHPQVSWKGGCSEKRLSWTEWWCGDLGRLESGHSGLWFYRDYPGWHKGHPSRYQLNRLSTIIWASSKLAQFWGENS